ncbi:MAG: hypothetical protein U1F71_02780 [Verrucomicrobiaceae bacterium]
MKKLIGRILRGYREHLARGLVYALLIYVVIALALVLLSPYMPDSSPGKLTSSEGFYGIIFTMVIAIFSLSFSGWFVADE